MTRPSRSHWATAGRGVPDTAIDTISAADGREHFVFISVATVVAAKVVEVPGNL